MVARRESLVFAFAARWIAGRLAPRLDPSNRLALPQGQPVARDKLVVGMSEGSSNIWTTKIDP